jgi:hypothetical protein
MEDNLFYRILLATIRDYFSIKRQKEFVGDSASLDRWFKGRTLMEFGGLDKGYTFAEYCHEFLGMTLENAEAIREMIVEYRYGDEETRYKVARGCFQRLPENHTHNDPLPWWREACLAWERGHTPTPLLALQPEGRMEH